MREIMRRTLGVGGATAVALGAAVVLAGPAGAHTPTATATCSDGSGATPAGVVITVDLTNYRTPQAKGDQNTVSITDTPEGGTATTVLDTTAFDNAYSAAFNADSKPHGTGPADAANTVVVTVKAWDDPDGANGWTKTITLPVAACVQAPPPPSSTTTSTTTPPPSTTTSTTASPPGTTSAVAAPVPTTTPPAVRTAALANTGVNAGFPLALGGGLLAIGAVILFGMRRSARRRG